MAFVIGRVEAGVATLLAQDMRVLEFPAVLLPPDACEGSVVRVAVTHNDEDDQRRLTRFRVLQDSILHDYSRLPTWSGVVARPAHLMAVLTWHPPTLHSAQPRAIRVYVNRVLQHTLATDARMVKLVGLAPSTAYDVQLVLHSSAGVSTHALQIRTSAPTDLGTLHLAFYAKSTEELSDWQVLAQRAGVAFSSTMTADQTTHLVTSRTSGDRIVTAVKHNIAVVSPAWLAEACVKRELPPVPPQPSATSV
eukprot:Unigene7205_Nuclearia_a/m.22111 Unigene7205_Nuclearia_a/g.22111  ORF Unigene7205_Nuclearia_a/g.22111 Unigene7205_Nuclearia_a/m.22111 type:complete len:250 (+) Unigene7205_Nuclearia_a:52-801(+)